MRCVTITFPATAGGGSFHDRISCPRAERGEAGIFNCDLLEDGTLVELVYVEGEPGPVTAELESEDGVLDCEVLDRRGRLLYLYVRLDVHERVREFVSTIRAHNLLVEFPIAFDDGGATVTLVGDETAVRDALAAFPEGVRSELVVERVHDYGPDARNRRALLTDRQLAVLETAVDLGYYADPRRATVASVADELGVAQSTVSEHLRRIEARILPTLARPRSADRPESAE